MRSDHRVVVVRELSKTFGDFTAVAGINFDVYRGEIFGFLGPNGSGKTTTIRMLLGLLPPTAGSMHVLGLSVLKEPLRIRPRVGYMSQRFSLYNDLTVHENLVFYGRAYGMAGRELVDGIQYAVDIAGLTGREETRTKDLAGGWRQRLALSSAILHRPELLFLDEPTAGVDPVSRRAFWDLLYDLAHRGATIFVTTHYMDEAEHCQRLALIQRGSIIALGTPEEIKSEMMQGEVLEIEIDDSSLALAALRRAAESGELPLEEVALYGSRLHVVAPGVERSKRAIARLLEEAGIKTRRMIVIAPSLEDVFVACMREE